MTAATFADGALGQVPPLLTAAGEEPETERRSERAGEWKPGDGSQKVWYLTTADVFPMSNILNADGKPISPFLELIENRDLITLILFFDWFFVVVVDALFYLLN